MQKNKTIETEKRKLLEVFPNSFPGRDYLICHHITEFTSLCPKTGHPDFGKITISYVAAKTCVELKSLKMYFQSYRNDGIFYENVINRMLDDLYSVLKPVWIEVKGVFSIRGGVYSTVTASKGKRKLK